jgi:hypothetical protein
MQLHTRGTWPARQDRGIAVLWLAYIWLGMLIGFGFDLKRYFSEAPPAPWVVHVHAVVFTLWLFVLSTLILLVERDKPQIHRKLGWFAAGLVCLMTILGPLAFFASSTVNIHNPAMFDPQFVSTTLTNAFFLFAFMLWGVLERKNPAAHRRLMILSTGAILDPGFSRITGLLFPHEPHNPLIWYLYVYYGNLLLILMMLLWDWRKGRLMKQFVIAASILTLAEITVSHLYFWPPWITFAGKLIGAFANHWK